MRAVSTSPRPAVPDRDPAGNSLGRLLIGVAREMRTSFERRLAPLDITAQQAELIPRVHRHGQPSRTQAPLGASWQPGPQEWANAALGVPSTVNSMTRPHPN